MTKSKNSQLLAQPEDLRADRQSVRPGPKGKIGVLVDLMSRPEGARIGDMAQATGWQAHSVRGAISAAIKKTPGLTVSSEKTEAGRVYRLMREGEA